LQFEARGDGRVFKQTPAAGSEVSTGQTIYVDFGRSQ
jgi:beta-lactam-binding protein with PASTA domain